MGLGWGCESRRIGRSDDGLRAARDVAVRRFLLDARFAGSVLSQDAGPSSVPLADPAANVVGVGIGDKVVARQLTGDVVIKIYVRRKELRADLSPLDRLPAAIDGLPTDVEEVGVVRALNACTTSRRERLRPAPGGVSIAHGRVTAGTLGVLVRDTGRADNGRRYVLSNNHVLANSNDAAEGDLIFQPGPAAEAKGPSYPSVMCKEAGKIP